VIFAPKGFAPAGNALAITVTSFDQTSGAIVDTDIVVNGIHPFAVLGKNARAASDEWRVPTDGSSMTDDKQSNEIPYDLVHVLSHEVGHSLGLADEKNDLSALMYGFTSRGDASIRLPSPDDINGVDALYETSPGSSASMSHSGCGQASVAGARSRQTEAWAVWSLVAGAGLWLGLRRRAPRPARIDLPVVAALVGLVVDPVPSAPTHAINPELRADAAARVVRVSTSNVGGLFETTLELEPAVCRQEPCPARTSAHVWGGTLGGIRQEVGSQAVPAVGDLVNVTFVSSPSFNVGGPAAQLVPRGG
jgi:hypothetical protein